MPMLFTYQKPAAGLDAPLKETLRYMGFRQDASEQEAQAALAAMQLVKEQSRPLAVYALCDIKAEPESGMLDLGFGSFQSHALSKYLSGAGKAICFAATIGLHTDMLVKRYADISPKQALTYSSAGTNLIESFCDDFCSYITEAFQAQGLMPKSRFSPGYGDFPLICQKDLLQMLESQKTVGIYLNESLLMTPVKSVTAVIALHRIKKEFQE